MTKQKRTLYAAPEPDYAVAPGETLRDRLDELGMSQAELARRTGLTPKHVNQVLHGQASLSSDVAQRLEYATATPARWWLRLEADYRAAQQRLAERNLVESDIAWVKSMPVRHLVKVGAIPTEPKTPTDRLDQLLRFFGVASVDAFRRIWAEPSAAFLQSRAYEIDTAAVTAWLRLGEVEVQKNAPVASFDADALRKKLPELRSATQMPTRRGIQVFLAHCRDAGLGIALVPEIPGARAYGATRWIAGRQRPLMQLSMRGKSDAALWDACFHEVGHVLLHDRRSVFIETDAGDPSGTSVRQQEIEATQFADDLLIPHTHATQLSELKSPEDALDFAESIGVGVAVVVSRLERDGLWGYSTGAHLKTRLDVEHLVADNPRPTRTWALPGASS